MNDYKVSDYGIFSNAVTVSNSFNSNLSTYNDALKELKNQLNNDTVFMGPICDSCIESFAKSDNKISNIISNFNKMSNYLIEAANDYKNADNSAVKVLTSDSKGTLSTKVSHGGMVGDPVYYNQNGYYDENGNWQKWQSNWSKDIARSGCGPTSMASILATMYGDTSITPVTIANMMNYDDNVGGVYVKKAANAYGLDQTCAVGLDQDSMNTFLRNDGKMIVAVNYGGHYIAVLGINDSTNPPTYIVCDPNDSNTANKNWTYNDIASTHTMVFHIAPEGKTVQECL